ncbi:MAG TPA: discoidin domain-containing protein, partial [Cytophagaceae bacterium]
PVALNGKAHTPTSKYRQLGNKRTGAMLVYQGPWGMKTPIQTPIAGGGEWGTGALWVRYYAPDKNKNPLGGVPFPKLWYELPTGEKYFISAADIKDFELRTNKTIKARVTSSQPNLKANGPSIGWFKSFGIVRSILNSVAQQNGWTHPDTLKRINEIDLGATGRGESQKPPGNYEPHATTNNWATYIGRAMTVEPGMVAVLTGKLPTFPDTRTGAQKMGNGQVRYWSIGGYDNDPLSPLPGAVLHNVMDDEITIDKDRNYIIAYSRAESRPANANNNNGVTWVNWGPTSDQGWMMRWVTVAPEWSFEKSPQEWNLPWGKADWSGSQYDSTLLGVNHHKGWMGCYLPRVSYMTKQEFEALGNNIKAEDIPVWIDNRYITGLSEAKNRPANGSSILRNDQSSGPSKAFDGNLNTSWASDWGNGNESITVDLGISKKISGVKLTWEFISQASTYEIQVSDNNETFTTIYSTTTADGGIDVINNLKATARYVKLSATKGPLGGYILKEMEVYSPQMDCNSTTTNNINGVSKEHSKISIYPNPASHYLKLEIKDFDYTNGTPIEVSVYDVNSKLYLKRTVKSTLSEIDISDLRQGTYIINLKYDNKNHSHHFNVMRN